MAFCDVILPSVLAQFTVAEAVTIILHELAHVHEYLNHEEAVAERPRSESEQSAWMRAAEWAAGSSLDPDLVEAIKFESLHAQLQDSLQDLLDNIIKDLR